VNYQWVPIGYHGRASSIVVSGTDVHRPQAQLKALTDDVPKLAPSQKLDYELEIGAYIGVGNALGDTIALDDYAAHVFGLCLLNDWSARDVQAWEYQPLGPFLSKNFASSVSPWVVTMEALWPYFAAWSRAADEPQPLAYLDSTAHRASGALQIELEVALQTETMRTNDAWSTVSCSNYRDAYWSLAQMVAHHTINGCNLQTGDLLGSGTQSGPTLDQAGALIELTANGKNPITLSNGETRAFLQDGDAVKMTAFCAAEGHARIGFGSVVGRVLEAK
jgi:fumarylacetoacetase